MHGMIVWTADGETQHYGGDLVLSQDEDGQLYLCAETCEYGVKLSVESIDKLRAALARHVAAGR